MSNTVKETEGIKKSFTNPHKSPTHGSSYHAHVNHISQHDWDSETYQSSTNEKSDENSDPLANDEVLTEEISNLKLDKRCINQFTKYLGGKSWNIISKNGNRISTPIPGKQINFENIGGSCKSEWFSNGACCNPEVVYQRYLTELKTWDKKHANFIKELDTFIKFLLKYNTGYIMSYILEDMIKWVELNVNTKEGEKITPQIYKMIKNQSYRSMVLKTEQFMKTWGQQFILNDQFCNIAINRLRLSAICQGCSPRITELMGDIDMKISKSKCALVSKSCSKSWFFIHSLISSIKTFWAASKVVYTENNGEKNEEQPKEMIFPGEEGRDTYNNIDQISKILKEMNSKYRQNVSGDFSAQYLCENLLSVDQRNDDLEGNAELLKGFIQYFKTFIKKFDRQKYSIFKQRAVKEVEEHKKAQKIELNSFMTSLQEDKLMFKSTAVTQRNRVMEGEVKIASGYFMIDNMEGKGINLMSDYLGYKSQLDMDLPDNFFKFFSNSARYVVFSKVVIFMMLTYLM